MNRRRVMSVVGILILSILLTGCFEVVKKNNKPETYSASGRVVDSDGNGMANVSIVVSKSSNVVQTNVDGNWTVRGLLGEIAIMAVKDGYVFDPPAVGINGPQEDILFVGSELTVAEPQATISGVVLDDRGDPVEGVVLEIYPFQLSVEVDRDGSWKADVPHLPVMITPYLEGHYFIPSSITVSYGDDLTDIQLTVVKEPVALVERNTGELEPFTTIQAAIDAANDGETIVVNPGVHRETLKITKPLILRGSGSFATQILPPEDADTAAIYISHDVGKVVVRDLTISHGFHEGVIVESSNESGVSVILSENFISTFQRDAVRINSGNVTLRGNLITASYRGVVARGGNVEIIDNQIEDNWNAGIEVSGVQEISLQGNTVASSGGVGVLLTSDGGQVFAEKNMFRTNRSSGMKISFRNAYIVVKDNTFDANIALSGAGLSLHAIDNNVGNSTVEVFGNEFYQNTASVYGGGLYLGDNTERIRMENNYFTSNYVNGSVGGSAVYVGSNACLVGPSGPITELIEASPNEPVQGEDGEEDGFVTQHYVDNADNEYIDNIPDVIYPFPFTTGC